MNEMDTKVILAKPYARVFLRDPGYGYTALILEFPGCITQGKTIEEANTRLDEAADAWLLAVEAQGGEVPPPFEDGRGVGALVRDALAWRTQQQEGT